LRGTVRSEPWIINVDISTQSNYRISRKIGPRLLSELAALGNRLGAAAKIHRTVRCAPDCPVSQQRPRQRSAAQSAGDTWPEPMVSWRTGLSGVQRTVSGAPRGPRGNGRLRQKRKEIGRRTSTVHVRWCTGLSGAPTGRRQEWPAK
jgi:hypothetical protein